MKLRPLALMLLPLVMMAQTTAPTTKPARVANEKGIYPGGAIKPPPAPPVIENPDLDKLLLALPADCWPGPLEMARTSESMKDTKADKATQDEASARNVRLKAFSDANFKNRTFTVTGIVAKSTGTAGFEFEFSSAVKPNVIYHIHVIERTNQQDGQKLTLTLDSVAGNFKIRPQSQFADGVLHAYVSMSEHGTASQPIKR